MKSVVGRITQRQGTLHLKDCSVSSASPRPVVATIAISRKQLRVPCHIRPSVSYSKSCFTLSRRKLELSVRASPGEAISDSDDNGVYKLPVFPLQAVGLPTTRISLHIFEARYRVLFNTLLAGASDATVDEGLVQEQSPYLGSRRYGLVYADASGKLAEVGCLMEIEKQKALADGSMLVVMRGVDRFRLVRLLRKEPVLEWEVAAVRDEDHNLPPDQEEAAPVRQLADEVRALFCSTLEMGRQLQGPAAHLSPGCPLETPEPGSAQDLSFWVAGMFSGLPEQQSLLEMRSVAGRLQREREVLKGTHDYLMAKAAIARAFNKDTPES
mmetsp:Transcript_7770/g.14666  ORF Transcript_7770/g.14666 Transcript_7770/m.14666 type:complete len:326 (+) Transcript_7770:194-1171(+)|eukprot:CAMPEP_0114254058 /NCGR_PEP_ID=MMETSP0058-20121206/16761_1 /TAXON_ID=36894 /ORGANISM="Pyramimonas parkeae, CCMP726" /LENGTH=325 /DNA_ID=CAMNT_0001368221 /DNA_START=109 /DNA_END=1086 /DNA_ORIENTATION=-